MTAFFTILQKVLIIIFVSNQLFFQDYLAESALHKAARVGNAECLQMLACNKAVVTLVLNYIVLILLLKAYKKKKKKNR